MLETLFPYDFKMYMSRKKKIQTFYNNSPLCKRAVTAARFMRRKISPDIFNLPAGVLENHWTEHCSPAPAQLGSLGL
jgi:hypothetical protein